MYDAGIAQHSRLGFDRDRLMANSLMVLIGIVII